MRARARRGALGFKAEASRWVSTILLFGLLWGAVHAAAQGVAANPSQPFRPSDRERSAVARALRAPETKLEANRLYTLPELIDLAEEHNPETRIAWESSKLRASDLRIACSDLLPTLTAVALANSTRQGILLYQSFVVQDLGIFEPLLRLNYTVLDFGARASRISAAREQLSAANFAFNAVQLSLLFETARRYYRLLNAQGQQDAAQIAFENAETVRKAVDARLGVGLATLPDALEARAAASQSGFDLEAAVGQVDIARGDLLTLLGASPTQQMRVQPLSELSVPDSLEPDAEAAIERALQQRPDLARRVAEQEAAEAGVRQARSAYLPTLEFQGEDGRVRAYGSQNDLPGTYAGPAQVWSATLSLRWTIFDGLRREAELARSHEEERRARAEIELARDDIEQQVWAAYINLRTALRQRQAATALLTSAQASYDASVKSYGLGVRNVVDVVSTQRTLAQSLSADVTAKTAVLTALANLSYRTGDLLQSRVPRTTP